METIEELTKKIVKLKEEALPLKNKLSKNQTKMGELVRKRLSLRKLDNVGKYFLKREFFEYHDGIIDDYLETYIYVIDSRIYDDSLRYKATMILKRVLDKEVSYQIVSPKEIDDGVLGFKPNMISKKEFDKIVDEAIKFAESLK